MNYFNNDKTNQYFNIRTNSFNKILERKKCFLKYLLCLPGQNAGPVDFHFGCVLKIQHKSLNFLK